MNKHSRRWKIPSFCRALVTMGFSSLLCIGEVRAVEVDAEVLLVVDVTRSVSNGEYATLIENYAQAFESGSVLDSLQSGSGGSIAASLVFYGNRNQQAVGVGWFEISDEADAQAFADALRATPRPGRPNRSSIAGALDAVVPFFGDETGGSANGFESEVQSVLITSDSIDNGSRRTGGSRAATVQTARDNALASGVDIITALTIGSAGSVDDYFTQNVIGGEVGGVPAQVINVESFAVLSSAVEPKLAGQIAIAIPEPGWGASACLALIWMMRRRRNH